MNNNRFFNFTRPPLPLQISLPFLVVFLGGWIVGGTILGQYFSGEIERSQQKLTAELAGLVNREIERELYSLRRSARLLARDESLVRGAADSSTALVQQEILPLKSILTTDVVTVFDRQRQTLLDTRQLGLQTLELDYDAAVDLSLTGADLSTIVSTNGQSAPFVIGTAPIKNEQGIVGSIILGTALSSELLSQINQSIQEQIVVIADKKVVASTFEIKSDDVEWHVSSEGSRKISIDGNPFLAQPILIEGLNGESFELILLVSRTPLIRSQRAAWLFIAGLATLGGLITAVVGYWIAHRIARPIQSITEVTSSVVADHNFELQIPVQAQDEIGVLSGAVNQLIQWVGDHTKELELSSKMLETRVAQRTEDLSVALAELKDTQAQLIQTEKNVGLGPNGGWHCP